MKKLMSLFVVFCMVCSDIEGMRQLTQEERRERDRQLAKEENIEASERRRRAGTDCWENMASRLKVFGLWNLSAMNDAAFLIAEGTGVPGPDRIDRRHREALVAWYVLYAPHFEDLIERGPILEDSEEQAREMTLILHLETERMYLRQLSSEKDEKKQQTLNQLLAEDRVPEVIAYRPGFSYGEGEEMSRVWRALWYMYHDTKVFLPGGSDEEIQAFSASCRAECTRQSNEFQDVCPVIIDGDKEMQWFTKSDGVLDFSQLKCVEFRDLKLSRLEFETIGLSILSLTEFLQDSRTLERVRFGEGCELDPGYVSTFFEDQGDGWFRIKRDYDPRNLREQTNLIFGYLHQGIEARGKVDTYGTSEGRVSMYNLLQKRKGGIIDFEVSDWRKEVRYTPRGTFVDRVREADIKDPNSGWRN
ncbi:MAG: hypothetical protein LBJ96_02430 [Holosporaceae bacterium]|jgi:hypothetical protein|nr:hypothetical protein [Holosporaceae bacterium]